MPFYDRMTLSPSLANTFTKFSSQKDGEGKGKRGCVSVCMTFI